MARARKFSALEQRLNYKFKDRDLIARALTHASVRAEKGVSLDNERMEFLGDRVLGLTVAAMLYDAFPNEKEGALARRFNRLVRKETCAEVALELDLGRYLILSDSEAESGGRAKATILADACEAVLGAMFLDGGYTKASSVVKALWGTRLAASRYVSADPKSALQEWAQGRGLALPKYVEVSRSGPDHSPEFCSEVRVGGCKPAQGIGASKRQSETAAARALLIREGVLKDVKS